MLLIFECGLYCWSSLEITREICNMITKESINNPNVITCHWYKGFNMLVILDSPGVVLFPDGRGRYRDNLCFKRTTHGERHRNLVYFLLNEQFPWFFFLAERIVYLAGQESNWEKPPYICLDCCVYQGSSFDYIEMWQVQQQA